MLNKQLALKIFEAFSIERWNDLIRPFDMIEMDKAAEKTVLAYIIGKFEENRGAVIDWDWLIHASLFELLRKIALCDIKSPVQRMIRREYPAEYCKLNEWVLSQYEQLIDDKELFTLFTEYIRFDSDCASRSSDQSSVNDTPDGQTATSPQSSSRELTRRVLRAAHKFSSLREFEMIETVNEPYRVRNIRRALFEDIGGYLDLTGLQQLITKQKPYEFLLILEQLRFQTRWNQTPRVPKTSVLGHSFFVAVFTLLLERQSGVPFCRKRRYNNFFSALFHDLPEAVTRDIISPVKQATEGLPSIVKQIEDEIVKKELLPLMEEFYADELMYFTSDEFENRIVLSSGSATCTLEHVTFDDLNNKFNSDEYSPVDGRLVRCADHIAAFMEAHSSISHGITSEHLQEGRENIKKLYPAGRIINGVDVGTFFTFFD